MSDLVWCMENYVDRSLHEEVFPSLSVLRVMAVAAADSVPVNVVAVNDLRPDTASHDFRVWVRPGL